MNLSAHVADCLHRHGLKQSTGIVAVSGGPDSVVLAHLCVNELQRGNLTRLILAHVNHQLRGDESDADEAFVQNLANLWRVADPRLARKTTRIDMAAIAQAESDNLESIARRERYDWLKQLARNEGAAWIATGHTADDQAETVLFRLLRGSGVAGLGGMSERRPLGNNVWLFRPLLGMRRQALHDYLDENQLLYRVDSSNSDRRFTRNRIRLELMPLLQGYNSSVVDVLCRLADQAQELSGEIVALRSRLLQDAELPRAGSVLVFSVERLQKASANMVREMFRAVWQREGWPMGDMDFERWHRLAEIAAGSCTGWDFPGRIHARRVGKVMQIQVNAAYN